MKRKLRELPPATVLAPRRPPPGRAVARIPLRAHCQLVIERHPGGDAIALVTGDGSVRLRIGIDAAGSHITLEAASVTVKATGDLALEAERIRLHGRQELSLSTGAGAEIAVDASVRINGERIHLNA